MTTTTPSTPSSTPATTPSTPSTSTPVAPTTPPPVPTPGPTGPTSNWRRKAAITAAALASVGIIGYTGYKVRDVLEKPRFEKIVEANDGTSMEVRLYGEGTWRNRDGELYTSHSAEEISGQKAVAPAGNDNNQGMLESIVNRVYKFVNGVTPEEAFSPDFGKRTGSSSTNNNNGGRMLMPTDNDSSINNSYNTTINNRNTTSANRGTSYVPASTVSGPQPGIVDTPQELQLVQSMTENGMLAKMYHAMAMEKKAEEMVQQNNAEHARQEQYDARFKGILNLARGVRYSTEVLGHGDDINEGKRTFGRVAGPIGRDLEYAIRGIMGSVEHYKIGADEKEIKEIAQQLAIDAQKDSAHLLQQSTLHQRGYIVDSANLSAIDGPLAEQTKQDIHNLSINYAPVTSKPTKGTRGHSRRLTGGYSRF